MAQWQDEDGDVRLVGTVTGGGQLYAGAASHQDIGPDLELAAAAGKDAPDTAFLAPIMGNLLGDALTKTGNYLAGVIGALSVTGAKAARFAVAGIVGIISDGVTDADAAVLAVLDGDSAQTNAAAMFGVKCNNSTVASGTDYGLDLQSPTHDGFIPVDAAFYKKAPLRLVSDVVVLTGAAAPFNGVTGATVAGPGSLYLRTTDGSGQAYVNTGSKAVPAWAALS